jgi:hypothetical protein
MSYLGPLRLHFSGQFQADPSTVNNDVRHYDNATFKPRFQHPQTEHAMNGWWDPDGTGAFRIVGCRVTLVSYGDGTTCTTDPVVGMTIADADARVAGKIVDLDPQQQLVSQVWGLIVRLTDGKHDYFSGSFVPAPFTDIWWARAQGKGRGGDIGAGSMYQSIMTPVMWDDPKPSRFLRELRRACRDDRLSIKFNLDGYNMDRTSPMFTMGRLVGTIGPASANEPKHFVLGRQLLPQLTTPNHNPAGAMNFMQAVVASKTKKIYADFGNALPTSRPGGPLNDIGKLELGYLDSSDAFHSLGAVAYQKRDWYPTTAGIQAFPHGRTLTAGERRALKKNRLAVAQNGTVVVKENNGGLYQRADNFVFRLDPGETANVELWATQYGEPLPRAKLITYRDTSGLQPAGDPSDGLGKPPEFGVPTDAIEFPARLKTDAKGRATLPITASDPDNPRGYIDGQVYGVRYYLTEVAKAVKKDPTFFHNPSDFVSVLVFDAFETPKIITWPDLAPIFEQYGNLYPIMDGIIDFRSYESVVVNAQLLAFAFGLPLENPNSMPVTRDLSKAKRAAILKWLADPRRGTAKRVKHRKPKATSATAAERASHADAVGAHRSKGAKSFAIHMRLKVEVPDELLRGR